MRIGLISDTHSAGSGSDLPSEVFRALESVDLILHCGDLECLGVLDYLEAVAPVLAVRGYEDPIEKGNRLAARSTRIVQVEDISIGMVHDIQWPGPKIPTSPDGTRLGLHPGYSQSILSLKFGGKSTLSSSATPMRKWSVTGITSCWSIRAVQLFREGATAEAHWAPSGS